MSVRPFVPMPGRIPGAGGALAWAAVYGHTGTGHDFKRQQPSTSFYAFKNVLYRMLSSFYQDFVELRKYNYI